VLAGQDLARGRREQEAGQAIGQGAAGRGEQQQHEASPDQIPGAALSEPRADEAERQRDHEPAEDPAEPAIAESPEHHPLSGPAERHGPGQRRAQLEHLEMVLEQVEEGER